MALVLAAQTRRRIEAVDVGCCCGVNTSLSESICRRGANQGSELEAHRVAFACAVRCSAFAAP